MKLKDIKNKVKKFDGMLHDLDFNNIDEKDEISGDDQLCLIMCHKHGVWEWQWLKIRDIPTQEKL
ncbi:MAG: hypothetical protein A2728_00195 [Candidatus Spechtbacteria bacterium RIFCSPHIGHO2_01_FULL_38_11]|nr:MAG: hypothetical protein A2728_00195 [Candidatus Spechtbacteria bacterium RIFCSPHIGHO2_01_FULL_38_11]